MDRLLSEVIDAHGGLERWSMLDRITARLTIGGPFWDAKDQRDASGPKIVEADIRRQRIGLTPFAAADWDLEFFVEPERVIVTDAEEEVVDERIDPRASFAHHDATSTWDTLQAGYFLGYALWNYLTEPFLLTYPGIVVHETDPWTNGDETWRRLQVSFPASIVTHNPDQVFYFDDRRMLRRMDYALEVDGGVPLAHYTYEPRTFDGVVVPTRHRVHQRQPDGAADMTTDRITVDIHHVELGRS